MPINNKWYLSTIKQLRKKLERTRLYLAVAITVAITIGVCFCTISYEATKYSNLYEELLAENQKLKAELEALESDYNIEIKMSSTALKKLEESAMVVSSLTSELEAAEKYIKNNIAAPEEKSYNRNSDLALSSVMTADRMNKIIDYWLDKNNGHDTSPFDGQGEAFIKASQVSGLDPVFIFALASHESNFGRSNIAKNKHNYMGIGAYDSSPYTSALNMGNSFEEGLTANAMWVADKYYNQGQTTLNEMIYGGKMYSSSKDHWITSINSIMNASAKIK